MSVKIIIDSASDISKKEADENGLFFVALKTRIDEKEYKDGVDITHSEFYEKLKTSRSLPTTSQATPFAFEEIYKQLGPSDEAVVITIASKLSGTNHSAIVASNEFDGKICIVDSESATIGERILIEYAIQLKDTGLSAEEIASELDKVKKRIFIIARVDTLEYLTKGGRLSKNAAAIGTVLNIKPIISLEQGELKVLGKARGTKRGNSLLNEIVKKKGAIDFSMPFMLAFSGDDSTTLDDYIQNSHELWEGKTKKLPVATIGSTIGTHTGPGVVALAFFRKE